jgi:hypothetical protein
MDCEKLKKYQFGVFSSGITSIPYYIKIISAIHELYAENDGQNERNKRA